MAPDPATGAPGPDAGSRGAPSPSDRPSLDKSASTIQSMFAGVAPRYDLLNRLMTGFQDEAWRRRTAAVLAGGEAGASEEPGPPVLDLCCGTGDQALALHRRGASVAAADFCIPMLDRAREKFDDARPHPARPPTKTLARPGALAADALELPFAEGTFGGASVSFGIRNVADLDRGLGELFRVLAPGGQLAILEATTPSNPVVRSLHRIHGRFVLPTLGRLLSKAGAAYQYLPASVEEFPSRERFVDHLTAAGFVEAGWDELSLGAVCLYRGRKP